MRTKYRKKPVVIEARQMVGTNADSHAIYQWVEDNTLGSFEPMAVIEGREPWPASGVTIDPRDGRMVIATLEGGHWVDLGDWVIRGIQGEFYPVKDSIFRETYEAVEAHRLGEARAALARVESLADTWEREDAYACQRPGDCPRCVTYQGAVIRLRKVMEVKP